jgi:hypothetical protein
MEITLTTPAILFPAVSLLMLAYTNRFLMLNSLLFCLREIHLSGRALEIELEDMEQ